MNFEVKNVETVGGVTNKNVNTSSQLLRITIGVVGCPHADIVATKIVSYDFANSLTVTEAKAGITPFAASWVAINYPNI